MFLKCEHNPKRSNLRGTLMQAGAVGRWPELPSLGPAIARNRHLEHKMDKSAQETSKAGISKSSLASQGTHKDGSTFTRRNNDGDDICRLEC